MYCVNKNNYFKKPKNSTVYTPESVVEQIYEVIQQSRLDVKVVLDPALGTANLLRPFTNVKKIGVDIDDVGKRNVNQFIHKKFEDTTLQDYKWMPDLVVVNPPFNGCSGRKLYSEVFLKHIVELFGDVPIAMITPYGLRLNQKMRSPRWQWMRDNTQITSVMSLPLDIFEGVKFHSEVLFFNLPKIKAHYFLN
jgi:predicted RNA methylase